jgi:hypothetical protein
MILTDLSTNSAPAAALPIDARNGQTHLFALRHSRTQKEVGVGGLDITIEIH